MSAAAAGVLHMLDDLVTDETLGDSAVRVWSGTAAAASRTAFPDPVMLDDDRVLKLMFDREDREQATVVSLTGYESRCGLQRFMRRIVTTWMYEVTEEQQCEPEVFPLSVVYLDLVVNVLVIGKNELQLVAAVCMFIASKFRDSVPLTAHSLVVYTDCSISVEDLLSWELIVLDALKWNVHHLTPHDFLDFIVCRLHPLADDQQLAVKRHASTFVTVCIIDSKFAGCPPSLIATACVYVAVTGLTDGELCDALASSLQRITAIDLDCLRYWSEQTDTSWKAMLNSSETNGCCSSESMSKSGDGTGDVLSTSETNCDDHESATDGRTKSTARRTARTPSDVREISLVGC